MTEKDFRKLITDLELTNNDKEDINNLQNDLLDIIQKRIRNFEIETFEKSLSLKWGLSYHNENELSFTLTVKTDPNNNYHLYNEALKNEVYNAILFNEKIDKKNNLGFDEYRNAVYFIKDKKINILLRFKDKLSYQTEFDKEYDLLKDKFISIASSEFNLFKNSVMLIKYTADSNNIDISTYLVSLLLYYGLSENFTNHTYLAYLKEFNHALDDLLKGNKIEQDDQTYLKLGVERINLVKKNYNVIDPANPNINLTANFGEAFAQDMRKLKKLIQKLLEN